jgi:hypothetical protein
VFPFCFHGRRLVALLAKLERRQLFVQGVGDLLEPGRGGVFFACSWLGWPEAKHRQPLARGHGR